MDVIKLIKEIEFQTGIELSEEDISDTLVIIYKISKETADLEAHKAYQELKKKVK